VYDTFQYVSVEAMLRTLLCRKQDFEPLLGDHCISEVIKDSRDGKRHSENELLCDKIKFTIILQLFHVSVGTTNPLCGQSATSNFGVFYYNIKNLPLALNSRFANVHLLPVTYAVDLKKYGFDPVLEKCVGEIKTLATVGFCGNFPILGKQHMYVTLYEVACDNLALNAMLGFLESFSADNFCTGCYATQNDIQLNFGESDLEM
jgi:hypothetical protein